MTISRDSFQPQKNYTQVVFNQDVPLLDSELNEVQQIKAQADVKLLTSLVGTSMVGDDLLVEPGPAPNTVTVKAGTLFCGGYQVVLNQDFVIQFLSTPLVNRTDTVFIQFQLNAVAATATEGSLADSFIQDPAVGFPTTQRVQMTYTCLVNEGSTVPNPSSGIPAGTYSAPPLSFPADFPPPLQYVQLATLNRLGGNANVTADMIVDNRNASANTYVVRGGMVTQTGVLEVSIAEAHVRVATLDCFVEAPISFDVTPFVNTTCYVIAKFDGTFVVSGVLPTYYKVLLATVVVGSTSITSIQDKRNFQPLIYHSQADGASSSLEPEEPIFDSDEQDGPGIATYTASVPVAKFQVVCFTPTNNTVTIADNTDRTTTPAIAIAIMDVSTGNMGTFLERGPITNPAWSWVVGANKGIFLDVDGGLTQTPPTANDTIIQLIGVPKSSTTIEFNPSLITIRN